MESKSLLTVVIPCYNEEASLSVSIPEVMNASRDYGWNVIVVNDGSKDSSSMILERMKSVYPEMKVITHNANRGYGAALKTGIMNSETEFTAMMDADGQHFADDIDVLFRKQSETGADMVIGSRQQASGGSAVRAAGKFILRSLSHLLTGTEIYDINSGMKLFRTSAAREVLNICPDTMAFSDIIALSFAARKNLVIEHPIRIRERSGGKSTIGVDTAFDTALEILNIVMLFNPARIFIPVAVALLFLGLLWGVPIMLAGRGVSVGAALLLLTGVMVFLLGLIAEQLSHIRKTRL